LSAVRSATVPALQRRGAREGAERKAQKTCGISDDACRHREVGVTAMQQATIPLRRLQRGDGLRLCKVSLATLTTLCVDLNLAMPAVVVCGQRRQWARCRGDRLAGNI